MPSTTTQISAHVPEELKEQLERYSRAHGVKKGHLMETALRHHLQALQELPSDLVIPPHVTVTVASMEQVADLIENPPAPTEAMKSLFSDEP